MATRRRWKRRSYTRFRRAPKEQRYGGPPTPAKLYKTENKGLTKSGSKARKVDFVIVAWKAGLATVNELVKGTTKPEELWGDVKALIEQGSTKVKSSLGEHVPMPGKVGYYVELKKGVYQKPQLRVVCHIKGAWSHFKVLKKRKV